ncbi:MAG: hypothetical protein A2Y07_10725 [Planctomycetes bacterium GWF2_50_10]|nr:MAG: hypothetical protein A2Y07_10725 [Planctomycetes bacterium GWF2_50_10]
MLSKLPKDSMTSADDIIDSIDTAPVRIEGVIPPAAQKGDTFDVKVTALPGTQTTSLKGGTLYTAEMHLTRSSRKVATAQGAIYIDEFDSNDLRTGYIPGGGAPINSYTINLGLFKPDFKLANIIRNRINERFGDGVATAPSSAIITFEIPAEYQGQRQKFLAMVKSLYIGESMDMRKKRVEQLVAELGDPAKGRLAQIALEGLGRTEQEAVKPALKSSDPNTRLRAGKCLLAMGDNEALEVLRAFAADNASPYQLEAINSVALDGPRNEALNILRPILASSSDKIRIVVYEHLRRLNDPLITTTRIGSNFEVDEVKITSPAQVYAYRAGHRRIVLFGTPQLSADVFAQSLNNEIVITSLAGDANVSVIRKHPRRNVIIGPIKTRRDLIDVIIGMAGAPPEQNRRVGRYGLGVPYSDLVAMLKVMCDKGSIAAKFDQSAMPKIKIEQPADKK